jgi:hypothetical protein
MQLHRHREWPYWPLLSQAKLTCNSVRQVVLHSVETHQRAHHPVQVLICVTRGAQLKLHHPYVVVRLPSYLQNIELHIVAKIASKHQNGAWIPCSQL